MGFRETLSGLRNNGSNQVRLRTVWW